MQPENNSPMKIFLLSAPLVLFFLSATAQISPTLKYCSTSENEKKYFASHPELVPLLEKENEKLESYTKQFFAKEKSSQAGTVYVIPVVFHILHDYGSENISDDQVYDAMRILNEDFRKKNADSSLTVASFKSIAWDAEIEFRLAQKDPSGNCTNGIDRIWTMQTYIGDDNSKLNQWPRNKYLNIWVAKNLVSGAAGYSFLPPNTIWDPTIDGVMILNTYVGSTGTGNPGTDGALTHEVGHWLNLQHPWGSTNSPGVSCGDDQVNDTPETKGWTSCNLTGSVCNPPAIENVQNFMDYSYCETMYSKDQTTRMRAALTSNTAGRNNLWTASNLLSTGVSNTPALCNSEFYTPNTTVCAGSNVQFFDASFNSDPTLWIWNLTGAEPPSSTLKNPIIIYNVPGTYPVSLTVGDGTNSFSTTKNSYITVLPSPGKSTPFTESFEISSFPNPDWTISNQDNSSFKWDLKTGVAFTGSKCLKMNNYGNDTIQKDDLLSSTLDLSNLTSASIKFRVAYCQRSSTTSDKLTLFVSTNCGNTWSPRFAKAGNLLATTAIQNSAFTPSSSSQWVEFTASLTATFLTENFRMKFTFDADGGNNLYLDDINITGVFNPVPQLESPANNSLNVSNNPTLDWKSAGSVDSYEYQLDMVQTFNSGNLITGTNPFVSLTSGSTDTEFKPGNLTLNKKYFWRVRSSTSGTPSAWSSTWNFTVGNTNSNGLTEASGLNTKFNIFPNPNKGNFTVVSSSNSNFKIEIYNILGEKIYNKEVVKAASVSVDLADNPNGIYFIRLEENGIAEVKKIDIFK